MLSSSAMESWLFTGLMSSSFKALPHTKKSIPMSRRRKARIAYWFATVAKIKCHSMASIIEIHFLVFLATESLSKLKVLKVFISSKPLSLAYG